MTFMGKLDAPCSATSAEIYEDLKSMNNRIEISEEQKKEKAIAWLGESDDNLWEAIGYEGVQQKQIIADGKVVFVTGMDISDKICDLIDRATSGDITSYTRLGELIADQAIEYAKLVTEDKT
tara:strand:- start:1299 stop:1664 length:366 start_codon:yes stop_codon:yes gene_type:complete